VLAQSVALALGEKLGERAPSEVTALDRSPLEHRPLRRVETRDAGRKHGLDARRQSCRVAALQIGGDELFEEQRVALGRSNDPGHRDRPELVWADRLDELFRVALGQGLQGQHRSVLVFVGA